ncbi:hypothetical protein UFOVP116_412 [uncultured Caudovirales phage]|uniref:Uncharacterized protein n=1 Tax=uncultured Caudovirales phage TaxID=2100421 RepID=A0A6J5LAE2_9CAUD|nr:hypothetical protein UFOVP116_412 [uncultured Caudovirales phage]
MKTNYLNNKDLLKEIHLSKKSYTAYKSPKDVDYDMIIHDFSDLLKPETIELGRKMRAERLAKWDFDAAKTKGEAVKAAQFAIPVEQILGAEVVFRLMTKVHIPEMEAKACEPTSDDIDAATEYDEDLPIKYVKVNFPPYQHYRVFKEPILGTLEPVCVAKSHWKGDLETGSYCRDHGAMTRRLAHMFMKLCERYGTRSNWRNYTYNDEMRSQALLQLSQIGLQFDESKSQNPFAYFTSVITNSFTRVLNIEKRNQNIRDDILEMNGMNPSFSRQNSGSNHGGYEE